MYRLLVFIKAETKKEKHILISKMLKLSIEDILFVYYNFYKSLLFSCLDEE